MLQSDFEIKSKITINHEFITTDIFGNIFLINKNTIIKYNSNFEKECQFSGNYYDSFELIDVVDPFKIQVFSKNQNKIIFLDSRLTETGIEINTEILNILKPTAVCSFQNGILIWDEQEFCLYRYSNNKLYKFTKNMRSFFSESPNFLISNGRMVYLNIPNQAVVCLDNQGNFKYLNNKINSTQISIIDSGIAVFSKQSNDVQFYDSELQFQKRIVIPDTFIINSGHISNNKIYLSNNKAVFVGEF